MCRRRRRAPSVSTDPRDFAAHVGRECAAAADRLNRLQSAICDELISVDLSDRMMEEMQTLDALHQTLADLGHVFARLSLGRDGGCDRQRISNAVLGEALQTSLRDRLTGRSTASEYPETELF